MLAAAGDNRQLRLLKSHQQLNHLDGVLLLRVSKPHLLKVLRHLNPLDGVQLPLLNLPRFNLLVDGWHHLLPLPNLPSLRVDGVLQLRLPPTTITTTDGAILPVVVQHGKPSPNTSTQRWSSISALLSSSISPNIDWLALATC
jgi:hypothetical protein